MGQLELIDEQYRLYESDDTIVRAFIRNGKFLLTGQDFGEDVERFTGRDEYEYFCELDARNTRTFIVALKKRYGETGNLKDMLKKEYGCKDASVKFMRLCDDEKIRYDFHSF